MLLRSRLILRTFERKSVCVRVPMVRQSFWLTALVGSAQSFPLTVTKGQSHNFGTLIQHHHRTHHTARIGNDNHFNSYTPLAETRLFSTLAVDDDAATDDSYDYAVQEDLHDGMPTFASVPNLHPSLKSALDKAGLLKMTEVQHKTWEAASSGTDVLARARTGTGKTVAFLLPAIQQIVSQQQRNNKNNANKGIQILILSPTRELASQIHDQAKLLTIHLKDTISSQVVFGGTSRNADVSNFEKRPPTILVATPGRLKDHLVATKLRAGRFSDLLKSTSVLVLDETDRMLDMGFKKEVDEIIRYLPVSRQTLLFSATVPDVLRKVMAATMKKNFITVDCIQNNSEHTNSQVEQSHVIIKDDTKRMVTGTVEILMNIINAGKREAAPTKMVVFFPTSNMVAFYAALFRDGLGIPVFELHSRKSQAFRTKTADRFRKHDSGILFTSDVSARGVDYPGVTNVVQVGIADSKEAYIHRLGRTGRAGKVGAGLLVLTKAEQRFLKDLKGIKVPVDRLVQEQMDLPPSDALMAKLGPVLKSIGNGSNAELSDAASSAYRSILGFYNSKTSKLGFTGSDQMIKFCNGFALQAGFSQTPPIEANVVQKMGLAKARGLNVVANIPQPLRNSAGRQGGDSRSSGGGAGRFTSGGRGGGGEGSRSGGERSRSRGPSADRFDSLVEGSGSRGPYSASRRGNDDRGRNN